MVIAVVVMVIKKGLASERTRKQEYVFTLICSRVFQAQLPLQIVMYMYCTYRKKNRAQQMIHFEPGLLGPPKSDTIVTSTSTSNLITDIDSPDYDDLPPRIPPKQDLSAKAAST